MMLTLLDFPLFPERASTVAGEVDALFLFLVALSVFMAVAISLTIFYFAIKYRRRPGNEIAQEGEPGPLLEATWIIIPTIVFMGIFVWGAKVYFHNSRVPDNALDVYATGKQWMWKFQQPTGQREINTLHVPVGRAVKITMASEDVIHSLFFPYFRVKMDVLPSRYRTMWFQATKVGRYHIFCAEYCGTLHSGMIGWVEVMEPAAYQQWLAGGTEGSLASQGEKLFTKYACITCHTGDSTGRGPVLNGVYGSDVMLDDNSTVKADDNYIRESILNPQAKIVKGFARPSIMPTFQGQVNEEDLIKLLAYVKSLPAPAKPGLPAMTLSPQGFQSNAGATSQNPPTGTGAPSPATTPTTTGGTR